MMLRINTNGGLYVVIFFGGILLWPLFPLMGPTWTGAPLPETSTVILPVIINTVINVLIYQRCSSPALSYYEGLSAMAGRFIGGCVNLTVVYIFFVILLFHALAGLLVLVGLFMGEGWTEKRFQDLAVRVTSRP
tara:strand:+ start:1069 stop:1470 length:402 start_codon:yes stop_codon:yes gene_type:complete